MTAAERAAILSQRVLAACDAEDWQAATEALADHEAWMRAEAAAGRLRDEAELTCLLTAQQTLGKALQQRLAECADVLGGMSQAGRGARAYRAESER